MTETRVQYHLKNHLPDLVGLIGDADFPWLDIDNMVLKKINERIKASGGETIMVEANLYDMIVYAKKGNNQAIGLLDFLNKVFKELQSNINSNEKKLIISTLKKILTSLNKDYLNFVGEIATLNNFKKKKIFTLEKTEAELGNGKSIDFLLSRQDNNQRQLIEIINIHINQDKVEEDPDKIKKFLNDRLANKNKDKLKGLDEEVIFYLVPILWGSHKALKVYNDFFQNHSLDIDNAVEPLCYIMQTDHKGFFLHSFGTIQSTFKTIKPTPNSK
jgi:hypothetical protein